MRRNRGVDNRPPVPGAEHFDVSDGRCRFVFFFFCFFEGSTEQYSFKGSHFHS